MFSRVIAGEVSTLPNTQLVVTALGTDEYLSMFDLTVMSLVSSSTFDIYTRRQTSPGVYSDPVYLRTGVTVTDSAPINIEALPLPGGNYEMIIKQTSGSICANVRGYALPKANTDNIPRFGQFGAPVNTIVVYEPVIPAGGYQITDIFIATTASSANIEVAVSTNNAFDDTNYIRRDNTVTSTASMIIRKVMTVPGERILVRSGNAASVITFAGVTFTNVPHT